MGRLLVVSTTVIVAALSLAVVVVLRRCLLSPLCSLPGPWYAVMSGIWLWSEDMKGSAPATIRDMHRRYGPIIRIGPNEVSVDDVDVHNTVLYCQAPKFMKARYFYDPFKTGPSGSFQTSNPKKHAILRRLISKPFSRKSIFEFEPQIRDSINELSSVLMQKAATGSSFDLSRMSRCLSLDYISKFTYGECLEAVQAQNFQEAILDAFDQFAISNFLFMMLPSLRCSSIAVLSLLPMRVFQAIPQIRKRVNRALDTFESAQKTKEAITFRPLLLSELDASRAQEYHLSRDFLVADGVADIFAGTDTTSTTLTLTLLEIFSSKICYDDLHQELREAIPNAAEIPAFSKLETLPYLSACVKEGLRYSTPVRSRLPRVCPASGWSYKGHFLPAGTIISSSPYLLHYNESVFPSPEKFVPHRWLSDDPSYLKTLESAFAPFSKGSRICTGMNLALAEIYITIATLVRRFRLEESLAGDLKTRDIFGVVFDKPVTITLAAVHDE